MPVDPVRVREKDSLAQFLGARWTGKESVEERAEIKTSPADDDRQTISRGDLIDRSACEAAVVAGGKRI